ncbi:MAG TPA: ArsR family transcriptional regulator [Thermoplasmata archaeon]|nr:ArsR family transcriptional regulator [Thermoplasmata archaeon]
MTDTAPVTDETELDKALVRFLHQIGYLGKRYSKKGIEEVKETVAYRLVAQCFLGHPNRARRVEELTEYLNTSAPTIYRHLNRLRGLDLIEEVQTDGEKSKKGYRIRYGDLSKAWSFPEAHIRLAMDNFRKSVGHIQSLIEPGAR